MTTPQHRPLGFWTEMRLILSRAVQVWRLVHGPNKRALVASALLMFVTSACATLVPLLLGKLVDALKTGYEQRLPHEELVHSAGVFLAFLDPDDRRRQRLALTAKGSRALARLTATHRVELRRFRDEMRDLLHDLGD